MSEFMWRLMGAILIWVLLLVILAALVIPAVYIINHLSPLTIVAYFVLIFTGVMAWQIAGKK